MEPAFYRCKACGRRWSRMVPKFYGTRTPAECECGAGPDLQETDRERDDAYTKRVYGPIAEALASALKPK
jgi:hypothetical protein